MPIMNVDGEDSDFFDEHVKMLNHINDFEGTYRMSEHSFNVLLECLDPVLFPVKEMLWLCRSPCHCYTH